MKNPEALPDLHEPYPSPQAEQAQVPHLFLWLHKQQSGPYTATQLQKMLAGGEIFPETLVWTQGMKEFLPLKEAKLVPLSKAHTIHLSCPRCTARLEADESKAGQSCTCPTCQHTFSIPRQVVQVSTPLAKQGNTLSDSNRKALLAIGIVLFIFGTVAALTLYSIHQSEIKAEAARMADEEQAQRDYQKKQVLRQRLIDAYPNYQSYLDNLYDAVRQLEITQSGLESTLKNASSYLDDMWMDRLRDAKDKLEESTSRLQAAPPNCMKASFFIKLHEVHEAVSNLKTEFRYIFTVRMSNNDATVAIRALNQDCSKLERAARALASETRRDVLELTEQDTLSSLLDAQ